MRQPRLYLGCYPKTGATLLANVFREICREFGWRFEVVLGRVERIPPKGDVLLFAHSLRERFGDALARLGYEDFD